MDHCLVNILWRAGTAELLSSLSHMTECTASECHDPAPLVTPPTTSTLSLLAPLLMTALAAVALTTRPAGPSSRDATGGKGA